MDSFQAELKSGPMRKRRLRLADGELEWGERRIRLADVTAVSYKIAHVYTNAVATHHEYRFRFAGPFGELKLKMTAPRLQRTYAAVCEQTCAALLAAIEHDIEPRLRAGFLRNLRAGETVSIGGLELSREGALYGGLRKRSFAWRQLESVELEEGVFRMTWHTDDGSSSVRIATDEPNAAVLPGLLSAIVGQRPETP